MRYLAFGDVHVHPTNQYSKALEGGKTSLLLMQLDSLKWVEGLVEKISPRAVINLGDTFESMGTVSVAAQYTAYSGLSLIRKACGNVGAEYHHVLGNHDIYGDMNAVPYESVHAVAMQNVFEFEVSAVHETVYEIWPYGSEKGFESSGGAAEISPELVFSHCRIQDFSLAPGILEKGGKVVTDDYSKSVIIQGHYHIPGQFEANGVPVLCPGSLVARTWKDKIGERPRGAILIADGEGPFEVEGVGAGDWLEIEGRYYTWVPNPHTEEFVTARGSSGEVAQAIEDLPDFIDRSKVHVRAYVDRAEAKDAAPVVDGFADSEVFAVAPEPKETQASELDSGMLIDRYVEANPPQLAIDEGDAIREGKAIFNSFSNVEKVVNDVQFRSVGIQNFMSIDKMDLVLDAEPFTLVSGANGSGKTSVLEAVTWALFGKTPRAVSADSVIRRGSKGCVVSLRLVVDDVQIEVVRSRKPNKVDVFREGDGITKSMTAKQAQDVIDDLLGSDYETFTSLISLSATGSDMFSSSTETNKRKQIDRVLGVEAFSQARNHCKDKIKKIQQNLQKLLQDKARFQGALETLRRQLEQEKVEDERREYKRSVTQQDIDKALERKVDAESKKRDMEALLDAENVHLEEHEVCHKEAQAKYEDAWQDHGAAQSALILAHGKRDGHIRILEDFDRLGPVCGKCKQVVNPEHRQKHEDEARRAITDADAEVGKASKDVAAKSVATDRLAGKRDDADKDLRRSRDVLGQIQSRVSTVSRVIVEQEGIVRNGQRALKDLENASRVAEIEKRIFNGDLNIREVDGKSEFLSGQNDLFSYWEKAFAPKGIETFGLPTLLRYIEDHARRYSTEYFGGVPDLYISMEEGTIEVQADGSSYRNLSRGERARVDLVLQFAMYNLLTSVIGKFNVLVVDEIDDGLDDMGSEGLVSMLREMDRRVFLVSHKSSVRGFAEENEIVDIVKVDGVTEALLGNA